MNDVFRECRERVSAQDAARHYGLTLDRRGWALCPFHDDRHASMSFKNGRFRCWACNASGDAIDFVARLLGLEPLEAVERLNTDFGLDLPLHRKPTRTEAQRRLEIAEAHRDFEEWRGGFTRKLNACFREGHLALKNCQDVDKLTERETLAIKWQVCFEHWADALEHGTPEEQMEIFRERQVIQPLIDQILKSFPTKSGAA